MTIGIVGAGQLGQMLALAGCSLGFDFLFLDSSVNTPAGRVAPVLTGDINDPALLAELTRRSDIISFDWENVSVQALARATRGQRKRIAPPLRALAAAQDRLNEKRTFERLSIPTTRFAAVESRTALERAVARIGLPGVLKPGAWDMTARVSICCELPPTPSGPGRRSARCRYCMSSSYRLITRSRSSGRARAMAPLPSTRSIATIIAMAYCI